MQVGPRTSTLRRALRSVSRLRAHPLIAGSVAIVVLTAAVSVPSVLTAREHDHAATEYRAAVRALPAVAAQLSRARAAFAQAHRDLQSLSEKVGQIDNASVGYLPDQQRELLAGASDAMATALAQSEGEQPSPLEASARSDASTTELLSAAATLRQQARRESSWLETTRRSLADLTVETGLATGMLEQLVAGSPQVEDRPALPGLDAVTTTVLASFPRAGQAARDALKASMTAAASATHTHRTADLIIDYLAKAKAVHLSQDAADAAAAEAAEAAREAAETAARDAGSRPSTSGGVADNPLHDVQPPPVTFNLISHVPQVYANGHYAPGCGGTFAFQQIAKNQGFAIIALDPGFTYDYATFPTADSWGVNVYAC